MYFPCTNKMYIEVNSKNEILPYDIDLMTFENNYGVTVKQTITIIRKDYVCTLKELHDADKTILPTKFGYLVIPAYLEDVHCLIREHFEKHYHNIYIPYIDCPSTIERFFMNKLQIGKTRFDLVRIINRFNLAIALSALYLLWYCFYCWVFSESTVVDCVLRILLSFCMTGANSILLYQLIEVKTR